MIKSEILKAARALITSPDNWTQGSYARNAIGLTTLIASGEACRFCSLGAIERIMHISRDNLRRNRDVAAGDVRKCLVQAIYKYQGGVKSTIARFNDHHTHSEVLAVFDLAIDESLHNT